MDVKRPFYRDDAGIKRIDDCPVLAAPTSGATVATINAYIRYAGDASAAIAWPIDTLHDDITKTPLKPTTPLAALTVQRRYQLAQTLSTVAPTDAETTPPT